VSFLGLKIIGVMEEQLSVRFTGRINILSNFNHQYLGHMLLKDGEIFQVLFNNLKGLKAFYELIVQEFSLESFRYVVEPEVVDESERQIHYPYKILKTKMTDVLKQYREALKYRPPDDVRILIQPEFIIEGAPVTPEEFDVLETLSEWSNPREIYQHCQLLDHEITLALVSLRKKSALKIVGVAKPDDSKKK
jgi:hypothetical protein